MGRAATVGVVTVGGAILFALGVSTYGLRRRETTMLFTPEPSDALTSNPCISRTAGAVMGGCDVLEYARMTNESNDGRAAPNCTMGVDDYALESFGFTFKFSSAANQETFAADPMRYVPAYGGFCAYGTCCEDWWTPGDMEADVNPNVWVIIDDRLFSFRGHEPLEAFLVNKTANIKAADARWAGWIKTFGSQVFNTNCIHYGYR